MNSQDNTGAEMPPIDKNVPFPLENAVFALGWFWGPDARFGQLQGVYKTQVGYAGGSTPDPTYRSIGDHSEAVEILYNPDEISYEELLRIFWESHRPYSKPFSSQYMSRILYQDEAQRQAAEESLKDQQKKTGQTIITEIKALDTFYPAEDYHQKYTLQNDTNLFNGVKRYYPDFRDFVGSTAAARINGYLAGNGSLAELKGEIDSFGLPEDDRKRLLDMVTKQRR